MNAPEVADNRDRYFKGQHSNEEFVCFFRHHWIVILREILYFLIFVAGLILSFGYLDLIRDYLHNDESFRVLFVLIFLLATVFYHRFFLRLLTWFVDIGIITDMRIIDHQKTVFFKDTFDSLDMMQIQNIEKLEEGVLPSILKYGDIKIFLTASNSVKTFHAVPNAGFHFRCLNRQKEVRHEKYLSSQGNQQSQDLDYSE